MGCTCWIIDTFIIILVAGGEPTETTWNVCSCDLDKGPEAFLPIHALLRLRVRAETFPSAS